MLSFCPRRSAPTQHFFRVNELLRSILLGVAVALSASCMRRPGKTSLPITPTTRTAISAQPTSKPRNPTSVQAVPEQRVGIVRVIGAHGSFVLIETPSAAFSTTVPAGHRLHCRPPGSTAGTSTADLRVSPERRHPFVVADVLTGLPSIGDVAYLASEAEPSPSPDYPVAPFSTVIPAVVASPAPEPTP